VEDDTMTRRNDSKPPRPDFAHLLDLGDEVIAALQVGLHDSDQRMLLIGEARDLVERMQATLIEIEIADPTWPGWAVVEPPLGTMVKPTLQPSVRLGRRPLLAASS
jgi:hypothetical protein